MDKPANGAGQQVDPIVRFTAAAEALSLAIDHELREAGTIDLLALSGECRMLRLGFRTLVELLAAHGTMQLTEWDKAYTAAIVKETERIRARGRKLAIADALTLGRKPP
jgi:hypothetical protein